jgi:SAUR family protein
VAAAVKSLVSRTLRRCKSGGGGSGAAPPVAPGCFSVYVGSERARFVVPVERANHPLFRRLLDDAEGEHGYAAQGPLALPGCNVSAFLDVLWQMEELQDDGGGDIIHTAVVSSPVCGLWRGGGGSPAAGYRMLRPLTTRSAALRWLL